jgi:hypothetical protein
MNTQDILKLAQRHGVQIHAKDGQLLLQADAPPPPEFIDILKQHKPDLLTYFSSQDEPQNQPFQHQNDGLTTRQQRAINGLKHLTSVKQQNLIKNGYLPDNAKVKRTEWREAVMRTLFIQWWVMDELEDELWRMGAICYNDMHIVLGDWTPKSKAHKDNPDFMLSDNTGRTFCIWYDSLEGIH